MPPALREAPIRNGSRSETREEWSTSRWSPRDWAVSSHARPVPAGHSAGARARLDGQPNRRNALRADRVRDGRQRSAGPRRARRGRGIRPGNVPFRAARAERLPRRRGVAVRLPADAPACRRVRGCPGRCARPPARRPGSLSRGVDRRLGRRTFRDAVRAAASRADRRARAPGSRDLSVPRRPGIERRDAEEGVAGNRAPVRDGPPVGLPALARVPSRASHGVSRDSGDATLRREARERRGESPARRRPGPYPAAPSASPRAAERCLDRLVVAALRASSASRRRRSS